MILRENEMAAKELEDRTRLLPNVLNGGIGGIVGVACVFPIDLVKVQLNLNFDLVTLIFIETMSRCACRTRRLEWTAP